MNRLCLAIVAGVVACASHADPFTPSSDAQVVETLPSRRADPASQRQQVLADAWRRAPRDPVAAAELAEHYFQRSVAEGDPRYVGYAQGALAPWWNAPAPPVRVRLVRAMLKQYGHGFDAAVGDLQEVVREQPSNVAGWSWLAAIAMVQARYDDARQACGFLATAAGDADARLAAIGCSAHVDALTGRADAAAQALRRGLQATRGASPEMKLWVLTRLAETEERLGRREPAESAFREALALGLEDNYLLAAYADFLLDRGRPRDVLSLLKDRGRSDILLLRLALAAKAAGDGSLERHRADLSARFEASRRRGEKTHEKEEARFALGVLGNAPTALALAQENFAVQREPADARVLLEAAVASRDAKAAAPALQWLQRSGVESVVLRELAQRVQRVQSMQEAAR